MMKRLVLAIWLLGLAVVGLLVTWACVPRVCWVGAFLADQPRAQDLNDFQKVYGKKPYLVMQFLGWEKYVSEETIREVYGQGSVLLITWEPWDPATKKGVDYGGLLTGREDEYILDFARRIKAIKGTVFLRFAHEMNGNWYPWAGPLLGPQDYVRVYRHVRDIFDHLECRNVKWIFSVNWQNLPADNTYRAYYPGDAYVDFVGIDGYNWGATQPWSRWMSFRDIFYARYKEVSGDFHKPILLTEFGTTGRGGDKKDWIIDAMREIKKMPKVRGFVLFNVNKELDWNIAPQSPAGQELRRQLLSPYFIGALKP